MVISWLSELINEIIVKDTLIILHLANLVTLYWLSNIIIEISVKMNFQALLFFGKN